MQLLTPAARLLARRLTRAIAPSASRLDRQFVAHLRQAGYGQPEIRAFLAITPAAAARLRTWNQFLEQVEYNGRRLAKLNVAPAAVDEALREFWTLLDPILEGRFAPSREQLHLAVAITVERAYYQVREAETQALFGLHRAVIEAASLDDLLRRCVRILMRAFHARAGRLHLAGAGDGVLPKPYEGKPLYIERGTAAERLIADPEMRGRHASYWSFPVRDEGVIQLGFAVRYPWLPRELAMLDAVAERCRSAIERARLEAENRRLETAAQCAEEEERRRIGRELHDEAGQSLLWLRLHLEMIERDVAKAVNGAAPNALPQIGVRIGEARAVVETTVSEIRRIIAALSPAVLERLGLAAAIRHLAERFQKTHAAQMRMRLSVPSEPLPMRFQQVIYRVAQECLQNISKHSQATSVNLSLQTADHYIKLSVSDNGAGFLARDGARPAAFGLAGMRERAALLGGTLTVQNVPGKGVTVKLQFPVKNGQVEEQ